MKRLIIGLMVLASTAPAYALYKCSVNGSVVFSDTPCASNAEKFDVVTAKPTQNAALRGADLCRKNMTSFVTFKDPDSVKLKDFVKVGSVVHQMHGQPVPANQWRGEVDAKNSYGAYTGYDAIYCYTDIADQIVYTVFMLDKK